MLYRERIFWGIKIHWSDKLGHIFRNTLSSSNSRLDCFRFDRRNACIPISIMEPEYYTNPPSSSSFIHTWFPASIFGTGTKGSVLFFARESAGRILSEKLGLAFASGFSRYFKAVAAFNFRSQTNKAALNIAVLRDGAGAAKQNLDTLIGDFTACEYVIVITLLMVNKAETTLVEENSYWSKSP